jgi:hypothetical protein
MKTIETSGTLTKKGIIKLDDDINLKKSRKVKVIILLENDDDIDESEWIKSVSENPAQDILNEEIEHIYAVKDSKAYYGKKFTEN